MTQDELEEEIFLAMLAASRADGSTMFDLRTLCLLNDIPHTTDDLLDFIRTNDALYGDKSYTTYDAIRFKISAEGLRKAREIEEGRRPPSLSDHLASDKFQKIGSLSISALSLIISVGALVVAIIALLKGP